MAVFNKNAIDTSNQTTIISAGAFITGEFRISSILHVDGSVEGEVISDNTVIIGKNGILKGSVSAQRVVINGQFFGNITAEYIELLNGGILVGDITARNLSIENGAKFNGKSSQLDDDALQQIVSQSNGYIEGNASENI